MGESLVAGAALAIFVAGVATWAGMDGEQARNVVEGLIVGVTGLPLLVLALVAIRHRELAGWTLVAIGVPCFVLMLAAISDAQAGAGIAEWLVALIVFAAPPLGGLFLIQSGRQPSTGAAM